LAFFCMVGVPFSIIAILFSLLVHWVIGSVLLVFLQK